MIERSVLTTVGESAIFLVLGYFINESHGWALAVSVSLIGILVLSLQGMARDIINRLSILCDKTG